MTVLFFIAIILHSIVLIIHILCVLRIKMFSMDMSTDYDIVHSPVALRISNFTECILNSPQANKLLLRYIVMDNEGKFITFGVPMYTIVLCVVTSIILWFKSIPLPIAMVSLLTVQSVQSFTTLYLSSGTCKIIIHEEDKNDKKGGRRKK